MLVSGIHGVPYEIWPKKAWNQKLEDMKAPNDEPTGFCTHSSILFLTWHRPYLALFEVCRTSFVTGAVTNCLSPPFMISSPILHSSSLLRRVKLAILQQLSCSVYRTGVRKSLNLLTA